MIISYAHSNSLGATIGGLGLAVGGYIFANYGMYNVEGGHRAIVYSRIGGVSNVVQGEGTHFIVPWFQRPYIFNVRSTPRIIKSLTGSRGMCQDRPFDFTSLRSRRAIRRLADGGHQPAGDLSPDDRTSSRDVSHPRNGLR